MALIDTVAEAFLAAVEAQSHPRQPSPVVYRTPGDLHDVQLVGQIDVIAAMRLAIGAIRTPTSEMREAADAADAVWPLMIDVVLAG